MSDPRDQSFSSVPPPPAAPRPLPPAGWFADPGGRHEHRYWDGAAWTDHVADRGVAGVDPVAAAAPVTTAVQPTMAAGPASGVAPPPSVPATAAEWFTPQYGSAEGPVRSLRGLATALTVTLWAAAGIALVGVIAYANRASAISDLLDARSFGERFDAVNRADDADTFVGVVSFLMLALSITILVLLIIWMWRVAKNAEVLGRAHPRWTPGWTIGAWFIPLANLVLPVLVMQELWRGSDPATPRRDPLWRSRPGSALVGWWWALYLASIVRFGIGSDHAAATASELRRLRTEDIVAAFGMAAAVGAAILLIFVIRRLTERQQTALGTTPPAG